MPIGTITLYSLQLVNYPNFSHKKINQIAPLPYAFNIRKITHLIQILKETPVLPNYKFVSLDFPNVYSNIPITET
jgi:hypothetical protein